MFTTMHEKYPNMFPVNLKSPRVKEGPLRILVTPEVETDINQTFKETLD